MSSHFNTTLENKKGFQKSIDDRLISEPELKKYKFLVWEFETGFVWMNVMLLSVFHSVTIYNLITHPYFEKPWIILYGSVVGIIGGFGVTAGAHRYFSHRSYKAKWPLRLILLFCYSVSGQYRIKEWVRDHRVHHKYVETDADPHNSRRGFFFSHMGWLMMKKHPEVIKKGQQIDYSDVFQDPLVVLHEKYFKWIKLFFCFIIPALIPPLAWGESWMTSIMVVSFTRYILGLNYIWTVNSAAHMWGNKPYDKNIYPVENLAVCVLAMGEGYHNYHHTFPWDYRAAEVGKFFNLTTFALNIFEKIGWAYDMKTTSPELIRKMVQNKGDGSHYKWGLEVTEEKAKTMLKEL